MGKSAVSIVAISLLIYIIFLSASIVYSQYEIIHKIFSEKASKELLSFSIPDIIITNIYTKKIDTETKYLNAFSIYNPNSYDLINYQVRIEIIRATKGEEVFDFYDDFNDGNLDGWILDSNLSYTVGNGYITIDMRKGAAYELPFKIQDGYIIETRVRIEETDEKYSGVFGSPMSSRYTASNNANADATILYMWEPFSNEIWYWIGDGSNSSYNIGYGTVDSNIDLNQWQIRKISVKGGSVKLWYYNTVKKSFSGITWYKDLKYIRIGFFSDVNTDNISSRTSYDWIRIRKYADQEPTVFLNSLTKTIKISNPNSYDLTDFQVYIPKSELDKENETIIDIRDQNGNTLPFCYEHTNGECDDNPEDIQGIWIKVPNIPSNGEIVLKYSAFTVPKYFKIVDENGNELAYCFEQPNGECNTTLSDVIWVKVPYIPSKGTAYIYLIRDNVNHAVNGDLVFDFYGENIQVTNFDQWPNYTKTLRTQIDSITIYPDKYHVVTRAWDNLKDYDVVVLKNNIYWYVFHIFVDESNLATGYYFKFEDALGNVYELRFTTCYFYGPEIYYFKKNGQTIIEGIELGCGDRKFTIKLNNTSDPWSEEYTFIVDAPIRSIEFHAVGGDNGNSSLYLYYMGGFRKYSDSEPTVLYIKTNKIYISLSNPSSTSIDLNGKIAIINGCVFKLEYKNNFYTTFSNSSILEPGKTDIIKVIIPEKCIEYLKDENEFCLYYYGINKCKGFRII